MAHKGSLFITSELNLIHYMKIKTIGKNTINCMLIICVLNMSYTLFHLFLTKHLRCRNHFESSFYRWGNWGSVWLSDLLRIAQTWYSGFYAYTSTVKINLMLCFILCSGILYYPVKSHPILPISSYSISYSTLLCCTKCHIVYYSIPNHLASISLKEKYFFLHHVHMISLLLIGKKYSSYSNISSVSGSYTHTHTQKNIA